MKKGLSKGFLLFFLLIQLVLSSCVMAGNSENSETIISEASEADMPETIVLTVSFLNETAIDEKIATFESTRQNVKILATDHKNDFQRFYEQLQTKLMTGNADDMFEIAGLPYYEYAEKGLLVNIYDCMERDVKFNKDEYFMNILEAMEYKGGLYAFPKSFDLEFITVSNTAPADLLADFIELESINYQGLVDLRNNYASDSQLYIEPEFTLKSMVYQSMAELVDFEAKTCDFANPDFIRMLEDYRVVVKQGKENTVSITGGEAYTENDADLSVNYLYRKARYDEFHYFIGYKDVGYNHAIPITNKDGKIIIDPYNAYAIYQGCDNIDIAWDFARFLSSRLIVSKYENKSFPVNKAAYERLYWKIRNKVMYTELHDKSGQYELNDSIFKYIDSAFKMLNAVCQYPARVRFPYFDGAELVLSEIDLFLLDLISAEQAAANIQGKMSVLLAE